MTDTDRLDFLEGVTRETNARLPQPVGWAVYLLNGALCLCDDYHRPRSLRQAIDDYRAQLRQATEHFTTQTRQEDVRASALLFEEQQEALRADNEARV